MRSQLIGNCSLKDLRQMGQVGYRTVFVQDLGVQARLLEQGVSSNLLERPWNRTRTETEADYLLNDRHQSVRGFKSKLSWGPDQQMQ